MGKKFNSDIKPDLSVDKKTKKHSMNINLYFGHSVIQVNKIINNNNQASSLIPGKSYIVLLCKVSKKKRKNFQD